MRPTRDVEATASLMRLSGAASGRRSGVADC
jgi:hypothetical protein